jgi:hypothetical protein
VTQPEESAVTWPEAVEQQMLDMLVVTPPMYQKNARMIVQSATEKITRANERTVVTEEDLAAAMLKITPPPFQGLLKKRSKEIGLDIEKYRGA